MKTIKSISLFALSFCILFTIQSCGEEKVEDTQLQSFMLGGIYFMNGYGGIQEVEKMMTDAGYTSNSELISGYKEIFEFPFGTSTSEASSSKRILKNYWEITDKGSLLASIEDLKTREADHKAWDFARIANNVCIGYSAGFLTKEECYPILSETLTIAKTTYDNWEIYYNDFDLGRKAWNANDPQKKSFEKIAKEITTHKNSIYKIIPLN